MKDNNKSGKVIHSTVCVVISQFEDQTFKGYVPLYQIEVSGPSIEDIKSKVKSSVKNIQPICEVSSIITFVELE